MTIYGLLIALMLVMRLAPQSALGRWLILHCVELPLGQIGRMEPRHLIYLSIMVGLAMAGGEMFLLAGPEVVAGFALELSVYLDAILVTYALATVATVRKSAGWGGFAIRQVVGRIRSRVTRRRRRTRSVGKPANDDEADPAWSLAA